MMVESEKYKEAFELWLNDNPDKDVNYIGDDVVFCLANGKKIRLGAYIKKLRSKNQYCKLTKEEREYWFDNMGLITCSYNKYISEMEYREALQIWLLNNPGRSVNDIPKDTLVPYNNGYIPLGIRIFDMKQVLRGKSRLLLLDFQKEYWVDEMGLSPHEVELITDDEYKQAYENWILSNKGKTINDIKQKTKVIIDNGKGYKKEIKLGIRIMTMRARPCFTQEQYNYWIKGAGLRVNHELKIIEKASRFKSLVSNEDLFVDEFCRIVDNKENYIQKKLVKK